MTLQAPPPLDPIRALHVAAMDALITATLLQDQHPTHPEQPAGRCARLLLNRLQLSRLASVTDAAGIYFINMHGITGASETAGAPLLLSWQESARIRLSYFGAAA